MANSVQNEIVSKTKKLLGEGVVERARLGEQNSQAMMEIIGKGAQQGVGPRGEPLAPEAVANYKVAFDLVLDYIKRHPNKDAAALAEVKKGLSAIKGNRADAPSTLSALKALPAAGDPRLVCAAVVVLARGPRWTVDRISALRGCCAPDEAAAFDAGLDASGDARKLSQAGADGAQVGALCAGHCVGTARRIQMVCAGESVAALGDAVAWEFGCAP